MKANRVHFDFMLPLTSIQPPYRIAYNPCLFPSLDQCWGEAMKMIFPQFLAMCEVADATTIVVTYWEAQSNFSETQTRCEVRGVRLSVFVRWDLSNRILNTRRWRRDFSHSARVPRCRFTLNILDTISSAASQQGRCLDRKMDRTVCGLFNYITGRFAEQRQILIMAIKVPVLHYETVGPKMSKTTLKI